MMPSERGINRLSQKIFFIKKNWEANPASSLTNQGITQRIIQPQSILYYEWATPHV